MKKLSVIIPVYNAEKYIERCLNSVLNQNFDDLEIIAVNDGSKDSSFQILKTYEEIYPDKLKVINQENAGVSAARNTGIIKSEGEYITFLDSDDYIEPESYKKIMNKIEEGFDIVVYDYSRDYGDHKERSYVLYDGKSSSVDKKSYITSLPGTWNKVMKKKLFTKNNLKFPEGKWYEDLAIIPQLALYTNKIYYMAEPVINYYQSQNSITRHEEFKQNSITIFDSLDCLYKSFKDSEFFTELEYLYIYHLLIESSLYFYKYEKFYLNDNVSDLMKERFPNWFKNPYYKKLSKKNRLYSKIFYKKQYKLLKVLQRIKLTIGGK